MRKFWFAYMAKALVVFPGGFGTLDEMFELLTLAQTHKLAKEMTIIIYGPAYWKGVIDLDLLAKKGAIAVKDKDIFRFADTPKHAFALLREGLAKHCLPCAPGEGVPEELRLTCKRKWDRISQVRVPSVKVQTRRMLCVN